MDTRSRILIALLAASAFAGCATPQSAQKGGEESSKKGEEDSSGLTDLMQGFSTDRDYLRGVYALENGDYPTAARIFKGMAEKDERAAEAGGMYGPGDEPGDKAIRWLRQAARQGDANAQHTLGVRYKTGDGVEQDNEKAAAWFRRAAEQGKAVSQYNLGVMYSNGEGVSRDDAKAVKWLRTAAEQGHPKAQTNLGYMYSKGRGVPRSLVKAHMWFSFGASQGIPAARKNREAIAEQMSRRQIAESRELAEKEVLTIQQNQRLKELREQ